MKSGLFNVALEVLVREKEKEEKKGRETGGGGGSDLIADLMSKSDKDDG